MIDILEKLRAENTLCELYCNPEDASDFIMGYIIAVTDVHYLMECVTASGEHGGFSVGHIEDVYKAAYKTQLIERTQKLMAGARFSPKSSPYESGNIMEEMLFYAQSAGRLTRFALISRENTDIGFVEDVKGRSVTFSVVDNYGKADGKCIALIDDLAALSFGGVHERRLEMLCFQNKQ